MAYSPTEWHNGDVITPEKLNKLENGVAGGGSDILVVTETVSDTTHTLNKTWNECKAAFDAGKFIALNFTEVNEYGTFYTTLGVMLYIEDDAYIVVAGDMSFTCSDPTSYPYYEEGGGGEPV